MARIIRRDLRTRQWNARDRWHGIKLSVPGSVLYVGSVSSFVVSSSPCRSGNSERRDVCGATGRHQRLSKLRHHGMQLISLSPRCRRRLGSASGELLYSLSLLNFRSAVRLCFLLAAAARVIGADGCIYGGLQLANDDKYSHLRGDGMQWDAGWEAGYWWWREGIFTMSDFDVSSSVRGQPPHQKQTL